MTGERSHYPLRAPLSPRGECSGPGWAEVWDRPLRLSTSTLPSSSTLQILMTWVTKADHGSARRQQGLICYYSATVGSGHQVGAGDTWEQILDRGHRTWPPSLLFLWIPCQRAFFFFCISLTDTNFSLCQQSKASSLTFTPHLKVKGQGDHWLFQVK